MPILSDETIAGAFLKQLPQKFLNFRGAWQLPSSANKHCSVAMLWTWGAPGAPGHEARDGVPQAGEVGHGVDNLVTFLSGNCFGKNQFRRKVQ